MARKEFSSAVEAEHNMMYAFSDLVEELKQERIFLDSIINTVPQEKLYEVPKDAPLASIAQYIGQMAYAQKEMGKKADMVFSFRQDAWDEFFSESNVVLDPKILPSWEELSHFSREVHDTFTDEIRFIKKAEILFNLINLDYDYIYKIQRVLLSLDSEKAFEKPASLRVREKEKSQVMHWQLPVYAN